MHRKQRMEISIRSSHISRTNESYLVDTSELETWIYCRQNVTSRAKFRTVQFFITRVRKTWRKQQIINNRSETMTAKIGDVWTVGHQGRRLMAKYSFFAQKYLPNKCSLRLLGQHRKYLFNLCNCFHVVRDQYDAK